MEPTIVIVDELKPQTSKEIYRKINPKPQFSKDKIRRGANWTAYNRKNLASIPTRNEYLIVNKEENKRGFSSQANRFKTIGDLTVTPGPGAYRSESYKSIEKNTSFNNSAFNNSKGFGGLISNTERFTYLDEIKSGYLPGPSDYTNIPNLISTKDNDLRNIKIKRKKEIELNNKSNLNITTNYTNNNSCINTNTNNSFLLETNSKTTNNLNNNNNVNSTNINIFNKITNNMKYQNMKANNIVNNKHILHHNTITNLNIKGISMSKTSKNLNSFLKKPLPQNLIYDLSNYKASKPKVYINYDKTKTKRFEIDKEVLSKPGPTKYFLRPEDYKSPYNVNKKHTNADTIDHSELRSCNSKMNTFYRTKCSFMRETNSVFDSNVTQVDFKRNTNSLFHDTVINELENKDKENKLMYNTFMFKKIKYNTGKPVVRYNNIEKYNPRHFLNINREFDQYTGDLEPNSIFMSKTQRVFSKPKKIPGPAFYSPDKLPSKVSYNNNLGNWI